MNIICNIFRKILVLINIAYIFTDLQRMSTETEERKRISQEKKTNIGVRIKKGIGVGKEKGIEKRRGLEKEN